MVIKYAIRGYMLRLSCYAVRDTWSVRFEANVLRVVMWYVLCRYVPYGYELHITQYVILSTPFVLHFTWVRDTWYVWRSTCHVLYGTLYILYGYAVRAMWLSLYDFPPLVTFQGRFAFRKWFCFLDLKIKNGWQFHFRDSNFSGKGNKGEYSRGCYFLVYIYKVSRCQC